MHDPRIVALRDKYATEIDGDKKTALIEQLCEILSDESKQRKAAKAEAAD